MRLAPLALASLALLIASPSLAAGAAPKGKGKARPAAAEAPALDEKLSQAVVAKLASTDPAEVLEGLTAAQAGAAVAGPLAPAIEGMLARGTTLSLAKAAIDTLGAIGAPTSSAVLRPYLG